MSKDSLERPISNDDLAAWQAYWLAHEMAWRTEPEINVERQHYLTMRMQISPDVIHGIYPLRTEDGGIKITRADLEWLLASSDALHRIEAGLAEVLWVYQPTLDLRGADMRGENLTLLPLMAIRGGLGAEDWRNATEQQREWAGIHLEGANLSRVRLQRASLRYAHFEGANLRIAHLEGTAFRSAYLAGADFRGAYCDLATSFTGCSFGDMEHGLSLVCDLHWGEANLATVDWDSLEILGDEQVARQPKQKQGNHKSRHQRVEEFESAHRANRQVSATLNAQGITAAADHYAYRANLCQLKLYFLKRKIVSWLGSSFLWLIAGYGYKPMRSFLAYLIVILGFAASYYFLSPISGIPLNPLGALIFSVTSFHGRGFTPGENFSITNIITIFAAWEAFVGLIIEITFIATFTNRFFSK